MIEIGITIIALIFGTGLAMIFFGQLVAIAITAAHNEVLGILSILLPPVAIIYCLFNYRLASYSLKLIGSGLVMITITYLIVQLVIPGN